jgi:hypothetical protein
MRINFVKKNHYYQQKENKNSEFNDGRNYINLIMKETSNVVKH